MKLAEMEKKIVEFQEIVMSERNWLRRRRWEFETPIQRWTKKSMTLLSSPRNLFSMVHFDEYYAVLERSIESARESSIASEEGIYEKEELPFELVWLSAASRDYLKESPATN